MAVEMSWYVLRAISGKEAKVKEYIETEIAKGHYNGKVAQVVIPTEKVQTNRNGKRIVKERNSMPGYVLVEASLDGDVTHNLRFTPNVLGFLPNTVKPEAIRQDEVNRILNKAEELNEDSEEMFVPFSVGDSVKVTDGPFTGFSGQVEKIDQDRKKVTVTVKVFGRSTGVDLGFMQVERE